MRNVLTLAAMAAASCGFATAMPTAVDLSTWAAPEGAGNWVVAADNNSVLQTQNGNPTVFFNGSNSQGTQLSGTITVETTGDDDFIGFVLGYDAGELGSATADYLLVDWKQNDQNFGGIGRAGLAISQVSGAFTGATDFWIHDGFVTELQRAENLGTTGWVDNQTYNFDIIFNSNRVQVFVDGVKELDILGSFSDGSFGFYNYSQQSVRYGALTTQIAPPSEVPVPAAALLFAPVLGGLALRRRRK